MINAILGISFGLLVGAIATVGTNLYWNRKTTGFAWQGWGKLFLPFIGRR